LPIGICGEEVSIIKQKYHVHDHNGIVVTDVSNIKDLADYKVLSIKKDFVYIHIPKTGGVSIHRMLGGESATFSAGSAGNHRSISLLIEQRTDGHGNSYDLSLKLPLIYFVRNPYDRLVSSYHYAISREKTDSEIEASDLYGDFDLFVQRLSNRVVLHATNDDRYNMSYLDGKDPSGTQQNFPNMWCPQFMWAIHPSTSFEEHQIYKFEEINKGFEALMTDFIGIDNPPKLPHLNKSRNRAPYQEYYKNSQTAIAVYKFYRRDFEIFEYSPNIL